MIKTTIEKTWRTESGLDAAVAVHKSKDKVTWRCGYVCVSGLWFEGQDYDSKIPLNNAPSWIDECLRREDTVVANLFKMRGDITYSGERMGEGNGWWIGVDNYEWSDLEKGCDEMMDECESLAWQALHWSAVLRGKVLTAKNALEAFNRLVQADAIIKTELVDGFMIGVSLSDVATLPTFFLNQPVMKRKGEDGSWLSARHLLDR